jgi:predicted glutamine amidotransferase
MCAISGAPTLEKAFNLYQSGLERGHYSSGLLIVTKKSPYILKQKDPFNLKELKKYTRSYKEDIIYCAFHSRAPTNTIEEKWDHETTHPFNFCSYYVAHNGIINNFKQFSENSEFLVDSSIIPYHLTHNNGDIPKTYSKYTGLLTSWIFESSENKFNLIKAGSSLHMDKNSFSSVSFLGSTQIDRDGVIFELTSDKILQEISHFNYNNPYFLL